MKIKANLFIVSILVFSFNAHAAWGMGVQENTLMDVDALIVNQRYDEAIRRITEYIKVNPDKFDEAQERMKRITRIRSAYNLSAAALIDVLESDPTNQERKLALIKELEGYEREPNPAVKEFVTKTKELALFTFNRAKFEEILDKGRSLIDAREFISAVRVYESGFALYRTEFANSGFGQELVDDAFERVATISGELRIFEDQVKVMEDTFASLATAFADRDAEAVNQAWSPAQSIATSIAGIRRNIVDQGRMLEAAFVDIVATDPTITENSFLPFAFRLILGRKAEDHLEGITGTIDALWMASLGKAQSALDLKLAMDAGSAAAAFDSGAWADAEEKYQVLLSGAERGTALLSLWSHYAASDLFERSTAFGRAVLALKGTEYLRYAHIASTARLYAELAPIRKVMDEVALTLERNRNAVDGQAKIIAIASNESLWALLRTSGGAIERLRAEVKEMAGNLTIWTKAGYGSDLSRIDQGALDGRIAGSATRSMELEIKAISTAMGLRYSLLQAVADSANDAMDTGKNQLEGVDAGDPQAPGALVRYPGKALETFAGAKNLLTGLKVDIAEYLVVNRNYPAYITGTPELKESIERAMKLTARVETGIAEAAMLSMKASAQKRLAEGNKLDAERRIAESRAALGSSNFEAARRLLEAARDRYRDSLAFEFNGQTKAVADGVLMELEVAIHNAELKLVVADTRRFLSIGKNLYNQSEFERAESAILQAKARWSTIFTEPDVEIDYWLKLVQTALTVKFGRSIPVTSPQFPEASRTLSLAKQYFQEGAALLAKRDKPGAVKAFSLATQKVDEIKALYPLNQEASILELRIAQLSDPEAFGKKFALMFAESKEKIEAGVELPSVYNQLKDMESIEPRYPGLKPLIENAEVLLGFRQSTPDPEKVAIAESLVKTAQGIFDSGRTDQYRIAIAQLEKALDLDPNNQEAIVLKDRIATQLGIRPVKGGP